MRISEWMAEQEQGGILKGQTMLKATKDRMCGEP